MTRTGLAWRPERGAMLLSADSHVHTEWSWHAARGSMDLTCASLSSWAWPRPPSPSTSTTPSVLFRPVARRGGCARCFMSSEGGRCRRPSMPRATSRRSRTVAAHPGPADPQRARARRTAPARRGGRPGARGRPLRDRAPRSLHGGWMGWSIQPGQLFRRGSRRMVLTTCATSRPWWRRTTPSRNPRPNRYPVRSWDEADGRPLRPG